MKSHLIPEPKPIEHHLSGTDATRMYLLDQLFSEDRGRTKRQVNSQDDSHPAPEMPMRNFLRVVFAR